MVQPVTASTLFLRFTFPRLDLFIPALRELVSVVLKPPFRTEFGAWWRLAVDEAEGGIVVSVEAAGEGIISGEIEGGVGGAVAVVGAVRVVVVGSGPIGNTAKFFGAGERGEGDVGGVV